MPMLNGNNVDAVREHAIVNDVRKSPHGAGANLAVKDGPAFRVLLNAIKSLKECSEKPFPQAGTLFLIPCESSIDFLDSLQSKVDRQVHRGRLTCSMRFSRGTTFC